MVEINFWNFYPMKYGNKFLKYSITNKTITSPVNSKVDTRRTLLHKNFNKIMLGGLKKTILSLNSLYTLSSIFILPSCLIF